MNIYKLFLLFILPVISFTVCAEAPTQKGNTELSLESKLDFQGPNGDDIDIRIGYGWYIKNDLLVKGSYEWALVEDIVPGGSDYRAQQADISAEYLFNNGSMSLPYVGIEAGWRRSKFGSFKETGFILGAKFGYKFFLNQSVALDTSIVYRTSLDDVFIVDFEAVDKYIYPAVGLKATF